MLRSPRILAVLLVAGCALLAGCTATDGTAPSASAPASGGASASASSSAPAPMPTPSATPTSAAEARYLQAVQQLSDVLAPIDPAILLALGHDVCRSLARGRSVAQVAESFGGGDGIQGFSGSDAAVIIGAAVPTLCPQYRSALDGE